MKPRMTGEELWRFDPFATGELDGRPWVNRGVTYREDGTDRRILFTAGLRALGVCLERLLRRPPPRPEPLTELSELGIPKTGTENYGGPIVTAGGLVFIAGTQDERLHAYDKATGELLWEAPLPAGGYATPSAYAVDGRQYVVIAAGGRKMGTRSSDAYVAFAPACAPGRYRPPVLVPGGHR